MTRILVVSDSGVPTGYGRICDEVAMRLMRRGIEIISASVAYDGLLPPTLEGQPLPYHVASLAGHPDWPLQVASLINATQPDIVLVIQDMPYAEQVRALPVDWSRHGFMVITPVDGAPVYPRWVDLMKRADAGLTISQFGVDAYKKQGVSVGLCRPGVNLDRFYKLPDDKRIETRTKLGLNADTFLIGSMCQNQGRKDIPDMIEAFYAFAQDKPNARLYLDMEAVSPAGWDIRGMILEPNGYDPSKVIFREDALRAGIVELRERYNMLDAHMVISHREGYGLPLPEAQACGVVGIALDYCSGTEVCGDGKGILVKPLDYSPIGTWGGAREKFPDMADFVRQLNWLHDNPAERAAMALRGMAWARAQTWDAAADNVHAAIERVIAARRKQVVVPMIQPLPQLPQVQPDGLKTETIQLVENTV